MARSRPPRAPPPADDMEADFRESADGFTLLDVVVAMAVLGLIMGIVPRGLADSRLALRHSGDWLEARLVAEAVLGQELSSPALRPGLYSGTTGGRRWQAILRRDPDLASGPGAAKLPLDAHLMVSVAPGSFLEVEHLVIGAGP